MFVFFLSDGTEFNSVTKYKSFSLCQVLAGFLKILQGRARVCVKYLKIIVKQKAES